MSIDLHEQALPTLPELRFGATRKRIRATSGSATVLDSHDALLGGRVVVRFDRFAWREEDEPVVSHPHDPYARIDVPRSDRRVRVEVGGTCVAESTRPVALFETGLPVR